jgi:mono/diheme cytochrome c family protein
MGDMSMRPLLALIVSTVFVATAATSSTFAADKPAKTPAEAEAEVKETPPEFTKAYLNDAKNQKAGEVIWKDQCRHCHGASAYPGKAPKLKPYRYKPPLVFDRITNGFEKMPAWIDVYTKEERMALVAFILSDDFSP